MKAKPGIFQLARNNFFLKKHTVSPSTMQILKDLYPTVNWNRVDFYEGLPWYTPLIAPYVTAQALPQFYSFGRFSIYIWKFDESRAQCLADIVHEGFHVMQGMQFWKGYGLGILRGFTIYYTALFTKHGYRQNPFEVPAHDQEFRFLGYCEKHHQYGIQPKVDASVFAAIRRESTLVFRNFQFRFKGNYLALFLGFLFCLMLTFVKPLVDGIVFLLSRLIFWNRRKTV